MNIKIEPLTLSNFNEHSLDDFRRRQQVTEVWRRNGNEMELVYQPFVEDWDADVRREAAERMLGNLRRGYFGTGAFDGGKLVGWTFYGNELIGERKNYVELHMFRVSELYRGEGDRPQGVRGFSAACQGDRCRADIYFVSLCKGEPGGL